MDGVDSTPSQYTDDWHQDTPDDNIFKIAMNQTDHIFQMYVNNTGGSSYSFFVDVDMNTPSGCTGAPACPSGTEGSDIYMGYVEGPNTIVVGCWNGTASGWDNLGAVTHVCDVIRDGSLLRNFTIYAAGVPTTVQEILVNVTGGWLNKKVYDQDGGMTTFVNVSTGKAIGSLTLTNITLNMTGAVYFNATGNTNLTIINSSVLFKVTGNNSGIMVDTATLRINNSILTANDTSAKKLWGFLVNANNYSLINSSFSYHGYGTVSGNPTLNNYFSGDNGLISGCRFHNCSHVSSNCVRLIDTTGVNVTRNNFMPGPLLGLNSLSSDGLSSNVILEYNTFGNNVVFGGINATVLNNTFKAIMDLAAANSTFKNNEYRPSGDPITDSGTSYSNDWIYSNALGEILWDDYTNLTVGSSMSFTLTDVPTNIYIQQNLVGIKMNSDYLALNNTAKLTFNNLSWTGDYVQVCKNTTGTLSNCVGCNGENCSYTASTGILMINVTGFSNYSTYPAILSSLNSPSTTWHNSNFVVNVTANGTIGNVTYALINSTGQNVTEWLSLVNISATLWNSTFNVSTVSDGNYTVRINASSIYFVNDTTNYSVLIDTTAPTSVISNVDGQGSGFWFNSLSLSAVFVANDSNLRSWNLSIYNSGDGSFVSSNTSVTIQNGAYALAFASDGNYTMNLTALDLASNSNVTDGFILNVDATTPVASILDVRGEASGGWTVNRTLLVNITATDANLNYWNVTVYNSSNDVAATNQTSTNYTGLVTLNLSADGNYTINLTVVDLAVNSNETSFIINVDSARPGVSLYTINSQAAGGWTTNRTLLVNMSVVDLNLAFWNITIYNTTDAAVATNQTLANYTGLTTLSVPADGNYSVNLTAEDIVGTAVEYAFVINVDTTGPVINYVNITNVTQSGAIFTVNVTDAGAGVNYCNYSGTTSGNLTNGTLYNVSFSGLSSGTSYSFNITCLDLLNNTVTNLSSFTTISVQSSPPPGANRETSSGGGGSSGVLYRYLSLMFENETQFLEGTELKEPVFVVEKNLSLPRLQIISVEELPQTTVEFDGFVYRRSRITRTNLNEALLNYLKLRFNIEKKWIDEHSLAKEDIKAYSHVYQWNQLNTVMLGENETHVSYESDTPIFNYFIIGKSKTDADEILIPYVKNDSVKPEKKVSLPDLIPGNVITGNFFRNIKGNIFSAWFVAIAILVAVCLGAYFLARERK